MRLNFSTRNDNCDHSNSAETASPASIVTNCHISAHRPRLDRCSTKYRSPHRIQNTHRFTSGTAFAFLLAGMASCNPASNASQFSRTGHIKHCGDRGVHTIAPSSIIAELKSPTRFRGKICSARAHKTSRVAGSRGSCRMQSNRQRTRATFPSRIGGALSKCERRNSPSRIPADARQRQQFFNSLWYLSTEGRYSLRRPMQVPASSIPGPATAAAHPVHQPRPNPLPPETAQ